MKAIDGGKIAQDIIDRLKLRPAPRKILAAVLVGSDPASISFLKQKEKIAKELGVDFRIYRFSVNLSQDALRREIRRIAKLSRVGGVIVQLPLPEGINRRYVLNAIPVKKDVDVLSEKAQKEFSEGKSKILPPAVGVVEEILATSHWPLSTSAVAIVGAGFLVGKPIAEWLKGNPSAGLGARCKEVKIFEIGSDLNELKNYDLVISGVGKAGVIKPAMLKDGAGAIDFGYSIDEEGKISGDFGTESLVASGYSLAFYTPTPHGTGPILVAKLMENFYRLNSIGGP